MTRSPFLQALAAAPEQIFSHMLCPHTPRGTLKSMAAAFVGGALMVPAMPPWGVWPMIALGLLVLMPQLLQGGRRRAFAVGWAFGFGYFLFGLSWIANALLVEGNEFVWAWPFAVAGLPAGLALFTGFAAYMSALVTGKRSIGRLMAFILFFAVSEWMRGTLFTGFPWNLFAHGWSRVPEMEQAVALIGSHGLSALTLFWCALPAILIWARPGKYGALCLSMLGVLSALGFYIYGHVRLAGASTAGTGVMIRIVQPNIPQSEKWDPARVWVNFDKLLEATLPPPDKPHDGPTLIVWPETAVTDFMIQQQAARDAIRIVLNQYNGAVVLAAGQLRADKREGGEAYYNSIVFYDRMMNITGVYDKSHLVPFGEYMPLDRYLPVAPLVGFSGFEKGRGADVSTLPLIMPGDAPLNVAPLICYEVIFPGAVINRALKRPDLMVNVTNDAWYGDSAGPRQHLSIARLRAIEEGLPLVRAANTGISALIDPYGKLVWQTYINTEASGYEMLPNGLEVTFFSKNGLWAFWAIIFMQALCTLIFIRPDYEQTVGSTTRKSL